jgi:hypothetical protein
MLSLRVDCIWQTASLSGNIDPKHLSIGWSQQAARILIHVTRQ